MGSHIHSLETECCHLGAPRRTSEVAILRLYHCSAGSYTKLGLASNSVLEAIHCRPGAQRRTSEAAMMKLYHSVMLVPIHVKLGLESFIRMAEW